MKATTHKNVSGQAHRTYLFTLLLIFILLSGCGSGTPLTSSDASSTGTRAVASASMYGLDVTVAGLTSGTLMLRMNTLEQSFTENGLFPLAFALTAGDPFTVTIAQQPLGQTCVINNSTGVFAGMTTPSVDVACAYALGRASIAAAGTEADNSSYTSDISADGRYVVFESGASNLVTDDNNGVWDVFMHDRMTGETTLISRALNGMPANSDSYYPSISDSGQYVAFLSCATDLVTDNTNGLCQAFVRDLMTGQTTLVSKSSDAAPGNGHSRAVAISGNGLFVAFRSDATNLVANDLNGYSDIFVHDSVTAETTLVSKSSTGAQAWAYSTNPSISYDGRYVAFESTAYNLVSGDYNNLADVFVHDRFNAMTRLVSKSGTGEAGDSSSNFPSISGNGRYIAYSSYASNLLPTGYAYSSHVFVYDQVTGETSIVSVSDSGVEGNDVSRDPSISGDGRYVAFLSYATNLAAAATDYSADMFVYDRLTGHTEVLSLNADGMQADSDSYSPAISNNGAYVAFETWAMNLATDDYNYSSDIYVAPVNIARQFEAPVVSGHTIWGTVICPMIIPMAPMEIMLKKLGTTETYISSTDEHGEFSFKNLESGTYKLSIRCSTHRFTYEKLIVVPETDVNMTVHVQARG